METVRTIFCVVVTICVLLGSAATTLSQQSASIGGMVFTQDGRPSAGVGILIKNPDETVVTRAITDDSGAYLVGDLPVGPYTLTLDPLMTDLQGQTIVADLGAEGLTINWTASASAPALVAKTSPAPHAPASASMFSPTNIALAGLGTLAVGGIVTGSLALSGFFHDPLEPAALVARVVDDRGNPVRGAEVTLRGSFGTCTTGGDGTCAIRDFRFESDSAELDIVVTDSTGTERVITTTIDVSQQNGDTTLADAVNSNDQQLALNVNLEEDPVTGEIKGDVVVRSTDHGNADNVVQDGGTGENGDGTTLIEIEETDFNAVSPSV